MEMEPSANGTTDDERVHETVRRRIDGCSYKWMFGNVTWHCNDGHLTLRGCVPSFHLKQMLQELLLGIEQVMQLTNSVDVEGSSWRESRTARESK
jgi:hypothetical protein